MRAILEQARKACDVGLRRLARLPEVTDPAEAYYLVKAIAPSASPTNIARGHEWNRANASYRLWATGAHKEAPVYNDEMLLVAATARAAEFDAFRSYAVSLMEERIFKVLIAANTRITGYW